MWVIIVISSVPASDVREIDFIPHAIFNRPIEAFSMGELDMETGEDDLDRFHAFYYVTRLPILDQSVPLAIKHYKGFPEGTASLYLPVTVRSLQVVHLAILEVISAFDIPKDALHWVRTEEADEAGIQQGETRSDTEGRPDGFMDPA